MEFKYMIKGTEQIEHSPIEFFSGKGSAFFKNYISLSTNGVGFFLNYISGI